MGTLNFLLSFHILLLKISLDLMKVDTLVLKKKLPEKNF